LLTDSLKGEEIYYGEGRRKEARKEKDERRIGENIHNSNYFQWLDQFGSWGLVFISALALALSRRDL